MGRRGERPGERNEDGRSVFPEAPFYGDRPTAFAVAIDRMRSVRFRRFPKRSPRASSRGQSALHARERQSPPRNILRTFVLTLPGKGRRRCRASSELFERPDRHSSPRRRRALERVPATPVRSAPFEVRSDDHARFTVSRARLPTRLDRVSSTTVRSTRSVKNPRRFRDRRP